jgi:hypothetical protein
MRRELELLPGPDAEFLRFLRKTIPIWSRSACGMNAGRQDTDK